MDLQIESAYEAGKYENSIYDKWLKSGFFNSKIEEDKEGFYVPMPPPNATGKLHLGHATMLAIQDIMIRFERMRGKSALWLPGTDHAAIATQSVVEKELQKNGIKNPRKELGREKLLREIYNFAEDSKDSIRNQVKKMGASCDWDREKYTLDPSMNLAVNTLFKEMFNDGLIYRGGRIVNWDPNMQTTVADDELEYVEEKTKFYYFQYGPVVIGTARPETKFLDKVIVVHPDDKRYKDLIGKEFDVEWIEGTIKARVIADECMDMEMGTGAMTITPAHSFVDFDLAQKYDLEVAQIIDFEGKIRPDVSEEFGGMSIKEAREKIVEKLGAKGLLVRVDENYEHKIAVNYRGKGVIEPQVMKQWFIDVNRPVIDWKGKKSSIKDVLQDTVRSGMIKIVPDKFEKVYFHWIDNLQDWCISRQIWWGHQIPVWYEVSKQQHDEFYSLKDVSSLNLELLGVDGNVFIGEEKPEREGYFIRDPDTLDTWFSSALWTFATLGWPEKSKELEYFHPAAVLETGYDILFFWVARMILASTYALRKDGFSEEESIPFRNVYLHGLIRDRRGKKMSKSNPETCIDPLEMIEKYGADALRLSLVIGSTAGNDMRLYEEKIAGYRNFINKIWNASRFALLNIGKADLNKDFSVSDVVTPADKWIVGLLQNLIDEVTLDLESFRYSDAGNKIYEFLWKNYCDWYLEISKQNVNSPVLLYVLKNILVLLHPFVPFVTEKLWEFINPGQNLIVEKWPLSDKSLHFTKEIDEMTLIQQIISDIRSVRAESKIDPVKKIKAIIYGKDKVDLLESNSEAICKLGRLSELNIEKSGEKLENAKSIFIEDLEIYLPLGDMLDLEQEIYRLKKEIFKREGIVESIEAKLNNPGFTAKAPAEVVKKEKARMEGEKKELLQLRKQLSNLSN